MTKYQKLIGLISLCPICHLTKHIGRAIAMGKEVTICHKQLSKLINGTKKILITPFARVILNYIKNAQNINGT
jgi:hypothetical protein